MYGTLEELSTLAGQDFLPWSSVVHLLALGTDGEVTGANQAMARALGRSWGDLCGTPLGELLTVADAERVGALLEAAEQAPTGDLLLNFVDSARAPFTLRVLVRLTPDRGQWLLLGERLDEEERTLESELLALNNELTRLTRENQRQARELARTLAELKQAQTQLVHQEKLASLGQMTAGIAHEINNPLGYTISNLGNLGRDLDDLFGFIATLDEALPALQGQSPAEHRRIQRAAEEAEVSYLKGAAPRKVTSALEGLERIKQLVVDLRAYSRLDEAERKPATLSECVHGTLRFLRPLAQQHGVTLESDLAELPPMECDPAALNQAISNLVNNAILASDRGHVVTVFTRAAGGWQELEVRDGGSGIPEELLDKVCDPFFTTRPVGEGTGLGLSITARVVKSHGAKLAFERPVGGGTSAIIRLPGAAGPEKGA